MPSRGGRAVDARPRERRDGRQSTKDCTGFLIRHPGWSSNRYGLSRGRPRRPPNPGYACTRARSAGQGRPRTAKPTKRKNLREPRRSFIRYTGPNAATNAGWYEEQRDAVRRPAVFVGAMRRRVPRTPDDRSNGESVTQSQ